MKQYDVKISYAALSDMEQIYSYIADRLLESDTAMRQYDRIAEAIQSLNILPERCALVESEPERTQGLLLDGGVDTKIECHRFFHGYHLGLIVTYFALQINNSQTYN